MLATSTNFPCISSPTDPETLLRVDAAWDGDPYELATVEEAVPTVSLVLTDEENDVLETEALKPVREVDDEFCESDWG